MAGIGLPEGEQMRYVAFSPRYGTDRAAYATSSKQLYRSLDGGESWTALGAPLGSPDLYDVAVDSAGHVQVASSAGVWRYTTSAHDIIVNGGFEAEGAWSMPVTPWPAGYSDQVVYDGRRAVRVGIVNGSNERAYSSARQTVTIPADALTATLSVAIYPVSGGSTSVAPSQVFGGGAVCDIGPVCLSGAPESDRQYVLVLRPDNIILEFILRAPSNVQSWQRYDRDLTSYAGETIVIYLGAYNDGVGGWTGMYVDDVSLLVTRPMVGATKVYVPLVLRDHP